MEQWSTLTSGSYRFGSVLGGLLFMALGVLLMAPLPLDGEWTWGFYIGSPWLGFLIGIPVFILGLWTLTLGVR